MFRSVRLIMTGIVLAGALVGRHLATADSTSIAAVQRPFVVFDGTLYKNKPSFAGYPIRPITVLYEARLFLDKQLSTAMPPEFTVRSVASKLRSSPELVVLDIERWSLKGDALAVKATTSKFVSVLSWMRSEAPDIHIGAYGTVPLPDYWRAIRGQGNEEYQAWQRDNDRLDELAAHVDALYPSIYTFYKDRQGWVSYAVAQITEARRKANGKPVYAFLWPQYHESNRMIGLRPLDPDYWELQLNTVYQHADGVVIWGGWGANGPELWNEEAPWWQVTKRFMRRFNQHSPAPPAGITAQ